jgi:hypothetical protein
VVSGAPSSIKLAVLRIYFQVQEPTYLYSGDNVFRKNDKDKRMPHTLTICTHASSTVNKPPTRKLYIGDACLPHLLYYHVAISPHSNRPPLPRAVPLTRVTVLRFRCSSIYITSILWIPARFAIKLHAKKSQSWKRRGNTQTVAYVLGMNRPFAVLHATDNS